MPNADIVGPGKLSESSTKQAREYEVEDESSSKKRKMGDVKEFVHDSNAEPNLVDLTEEDPVPVDEGDDKENVDMMRDINKTDREEPKALEDKYANERPLERKRRLEEEARVNPAERARCRARLDEMKKIDIKQWLKNMVTNGEAQTDLYFRDRPLTNTFMIDNDDKEGPFINDPDLAERQMAPFFRTEASSLFNVNYTDVEKAIKVTIDKPAWEKFLAVSKTAEKAKQAMILYQINRSIRLLVKRDPDLPGGLAHWKVATQLLKRLSLLDISNEMLKQTKIGKAINPYRKHHDPNVVDLAKSLLTTWKKNFKYTEKNLFGDANPTDAETQPLEPEMHKSIADANGVDAVEMGGETAAERITGERISTEVSEGPGTGIEDGTGQGITEMREDGTADGTGEEIAEAPMATEHGDDLTV